MTNKTKTLEDIKQELSQSEHDFLVKQKKELAKTIAETYKNWKTDVKGMSQAHFAELIETSQPRVSNIINGKVDHFTNRQTSFLSVFD